MPLVVVSLALGNCSDNHRDPSEAGQTEGEHSTNVLEWRQERHDLLLREDGWLTLAGLLWIEPGESSLGSHPESDLRFPEGAPENVGTLRTDEERATVELIPAEALILEVDGAEVSNGRAIELQSDAGGEPTMVHIGRFRFHLIERDGRFALRLKDAESPVLASFEGLEYFPIEAAWRFAAKFEVYDPPRSLTVPNVLGTPTEEPCPGAVVFERGDEIVRLDAMDGGDGKLFLVFGDTTNGKETYGGGRFILTEPPVDGMVGVDFNKSYNPPCIFTPYATCPLPPPQNRLAFAVEAGEKRYRGLTLEH